MQFPKRLDLRIENQSLLHTMRVESRRKGYTTESK